MKHGCKLRILIVRPKTKHRHRAQHIRKIRLNCNNWFVFKTFPLLIIILTSCTFYPCNARSSIELEQHDKKKWALLHILVAHYFQVFNFSIRWYLFSIIDVLLFNNLVFFIDSQTIPEITIFGTQTEINSHTKVRNCDRYINCEYQRQTPSTLTTILYLKKIRTKGVCIQLPHLIVL